MKIHYVSSASISIRNVNIYYSQFYIALEKDLGSSSYKYIEQVILKSPAGLIFNRPAGLFSVL
ncbi:hypothetical protein KDA_60200 [Dictyobacter alpinus]|uniref:Uncharacterized protein n=1 Tax=Dictyobacter alpinus TaxID=2014873 RepID=A0A402BGR6_9CHLR|nr:hypothetical protein KDA_60200 [Dictyobacter alpinus]